MDNLRRLRLELCTPLRGMIETNQHWAVLIDKFVQAFELRLVLRLKHLRKVVLVGTSIPINEWIQGEAYSSPAANDRIEYLYAVRDMAHELKQGFRVQGQDVTVVSQLRYSDQCDELITT